MINSDTRIDEALLLRYFEGEVTLSEKDEIEKWIISSEANKKLAKQIYYLSFATKTMDTLKRTDARAALKEVRGRIRRERHEHCYEHSHTLPLHPVSTHHWYSASSVHNEKFQ